MRYWKLWNCGFAFGFSVMCPLAVPSVLAYCMSYDRGIIQGIRWEFSSRCLVPKRKYNLKNILLI